MKSFHAATASSVVLTLMLAAPVIAAEQQRAQPATGAQTGIMGAQTGAQTSGSMGQSVDVRDIKGKQLVKELGKVDEIVREKDGDKHFAVVSVGDKDKKITIPLDQIEMRGDTLTATKAAASKDDLESQSEYKKDEYQRVSDGERIDRSEFAAFEPQGETGQRSPQQGSGLQQGSDMQRGGETQREGSPSGTRY